jgi:hypothetical protein
MTPPLTGSAPSACSNASAHASPSSADSSRPTPTKTNSSSGGATLGTTGRHNDKGKRRAQDPRVHRDSSGGAV